MRQYLDKCKFFYVYAGVFSFFINLLMLAYPIYMMQLFDRVFGSRSDATLIMLTIGVLGALLVWAALEALRSRLLVRAGVALDNLLGAPVLVELLKNSRATTGNAYVYGMRDLQTLRSFLTGHAIFAFFDAPWAPLYVLLIYLFHPLFGVIATLGIVLMFGLTWLDEKVTKPALHDANYKFRQTGRFVDASLRNGEVINAMYMVPAVTERWRVMNDEVLALQSLASNRAGAILATTRFVRLALQIVMLAVGAYLIIDQNVTPGVMIAATLIFGSALRPVEQAMMGWKAMTDARGAYDRLGRLLGAAGAGGREVVLPVPEGRLNVERVVYARNPSQPILKGVSFALAPGESLGLIGPSGAGKSTLARVVLGLWAPVSGTVRLDGASISEWAPEQLGPHIGYLPQDVELLAGSVADNIARLGDAAAMSEEVIAAAKRADVHELILRLPNGYETDIGEDGMALSGGQRQRVALARALFGNPRLVVLDEPNSNLDAEGEEALLRTIARLKEERATLIIVSHRPSLLAGVDRMLFLRNGLVEQFGPRQEVMARLARLGIAGAAPRPQAVGESGARS